MERYRLPTTTSFSGGLSQRPAFQRNAPSYISPPPKPRHLGETPISPFLQSTAAAAAGDRLGGRSDDTEISIFDAKSYFNDGNAVPLTPKQAILLAGVAERCELSTNPRDSSGSSIDGFGRNCRSRSSRATPTASSEASWNSQSGLLSNPPGSVAVTVRNFPPNGRRRGGSSYGWRLFGQSCPCSGKKSVDVENKFSEQPKSPIHSTFNSTASTSSLGAKKQSPGTGEIVLSNPMEKPAPTEVNNELGIEEETKVKVTPGNWATKKEQFHGLSRFSLDKKPETFPAQIGHQIVNSGRPFNDPTGFSFPILNPPSTNSPGDPARDSLEVFRPPEERPAAPRKSAEFQRWVKIVPFSGESNRRSINLPASPKRRPPSAGEDDEASDTSSDLFEIENLSTQLGYRRRDSLDELPPRFPVDPASAAAASGAGIFHLRRSLEEAGSECYAPSEASVEWSVTTAEGFFDWGSVAASELGDLRFLEAEHGRIAAAMAGPGAGGGGKRRGNGSGLLSCRCEKAVNIGPNPVRFGADQRRSGTGPMQTR